MGKQVGCTAVVFQQKKSSDNDSKGNCWRRKHVTLSRCDKHTEYDTYVMDAPPAPTPPAPTPPAPTPPGPSPPFAPTDPAFIRGFIEGLLSDNGTDAKHCESDVGSFGKAMVNLGETTAEALKAVASAVEIAREKCTPVAKDAAKLAINALGDFFHPGRIAKNYQATRTDVLEEIGYALEALANKDFKGAGNNVGKFNRRLIEGAQDSLAETSSYTLMGDLNCYTGHGAVDLESPAGQPCGEMTLQECEAKCDELDDCQGITTSPADGGKILCYRRGAIVIGKCDHEAMGYSTLLNIKAPLPTESDTVATVAIHAVTYWGFAAKSQTNLGSDSPLDWGSFLEGLLEGLMSDGTDFSDCTAQIPFVAQALKDAKTKVGNSLAATKAAAQAAVKSCGTVAADVGRLALAAFSDLRHPDQVVQHFTDSQYDILMDLGKAFEALAVNSYSSAGTLAGMAFRRIIEGKQASVIFV